MMYLRRSSPTLAAAEPEAAAAELGAGDAAAPEPVGAADACPGEGAGASGSADASAIGAADVEPVNAADSDDVSAADVDAACANLEDAADAHAGDARDSADTDVAAGTAFEAVSEATPAVLETTASAVPAGFYGWDDESASEPDIDDDEYERYAFDPDQPAAERRDERRALGPHYDY